MNIQIVEKTLEDIDVLYITESFALEDMGESSELFDEIFEYIVAESSAEFVGSFMLYTDILPRRMTVEACVAVNPLPPESGRIKARRVSGGTFKMARMIHEGSYEGLADSWQALMEWIFENNYEVADIPTREIYLTMSEDNEDENITELLVGIK